MVKVILGRGRGWDGFFSKSYTCTCLQGLFAEPFVIGSELISPWNSLAPATYEPDETIGKKYNILYDIVIPQKSSIFLDPPQRIVVVPRLLLC